MTTLIPAIAMSNPNITPLAYQLSMVSVSADTLTKRTGHLEGNYLVGSEVAVKVLRELPANFDYSHTITEPKVTTYGNIIVVSYESQDSLVCIASIDDYLYLVQSDDTYSSTGGNSVVKPVFYHVK